MALQQEPLADSIVRADDTVCFEATAGEENGPYDPDAFALIRGEQLFRGQTMRVEDKTISIGFGTPIEPGDQIIA